MIKLNRYIAESGYCSRRSATDLIKDGKVTVNGTIILEPFFEVAATDAIKVQNKLLPRQEQKVYFLFNKPADIITSSSDPEDRMTVMHFFKHMKKRLYPIGRLDRNTTGLIIITNDGDLTQKVAHPKYNITKTYHVTTHKPVTPEHLQKLLQGVKLEDGIMKVDAAYPIRRKNTISITIHSGKNHIIKRLFTKLRYFVEKLDRVALATLTKKNLPVGAYRPLSAQEIAQLKKS